jgi:taurine dioxygenase
MSMLDVERVTGTLGGEVRGINLGAPLRDSDIVFIDRALAHHKVLFFRDQRDLTPERQVELGRRFGTLMVDPWRRYDGPLPELLILSSEDWHPDGLVESWHSDMTCLTKPSRAAMLRAVEVPSYGRDTIWADMAAAFEGLSGKMQRFLDGLTAQHDYAEPFAPQIAKMGETLESLRRRLPIPEHPVIRTHPITGEKCIYVNRWFTTKIVGMRDDESASLLRFLWDQTHVPEYQVRFRWRQGDVAMWDNRSTQHCLVLDRGGNVRRVMHRITIEEDQVVA